jgi:hypothetical protein
MGRGNQFTYEALGELFDYYTSIEDDTEVSTELDVIGICCDWTEYAEDGLIEEYGNKPLDYTLDLLRDQTTVIKLDSGNYLVQSF